MKNEVINMSEEHAAKLMADLLEVFSIIVSFSRILPITEPIEDPKPGTLYRVLKIFSKYSVEEIKKHYLQGKLPVVFFPETVFYHKVVKREDFIESGVICATFGSRRFKLRIFDSPEAYGCHSIYPDYNYGTYLFADLSELREDGSEKNFLHFGFDIEKMVFLELFDIANINSGGIIRTIALNDDCLYELEKRYFDKPLLKLNAKSF